MICNDSIKGNSRRRAPLRNSWKIVFVDRCHWFLQYRIGPLSVSRLRLPRPSWRRQTMKGAARGNSESSSNWNRMKISKYTVQFEGKPNDQKIWKKTFTEKMALVVANHFIAPERRGKTYWTVNRSWSLSFPFIMHTGSNSKLLN
jgi:hypothetical protein